MFNFWPDCRDSKQCTVLHDGFYKCDISLSMFNLLLKKGAKTDVFCNGKLWSEDRLTPLHLAVIYNRVDLVTTLLQAGASPHLTNGKRDETALHLYIHRKFRRKDKSLVIIQELIKAGADPNSIDDQGTPLLVKLLNWRFNNFPRVTVKVVEILIEAGAHPNLSDRAGLNPLHVCAREGYSEIAEYLIQNGANPELKDAKNRNFQWYAEHGELVKNQAAILAIWEKRNELKLEQKTLNKIDPETSYEIKKDYFLPGDLPKKKESKTESPKPKQQQYPWPVLFPLPALVKPFYRDERDAEKEDDDEIFGLDLVLN